MDIQVPLSGKSFAIPPTRREWTEQLSCLMDFAFVAMKAGFVPECEIVAFVLRADIWPGVFVHMLPASRVRLGA
jgi:hypothetical protein